MSGSTVQAPPARAGRPGEADASERVAPGFATTQEVRFAVVMYGGVSLAIYINGVARELFRLVQATAPARRRSERAGPDGGGTGAVYRKLGQLMDRGRLRADLCRVEGRRVVLEAEGEGATPPPIRTRFVVDILSGTSAGGINAVYLAKALANDGDFEVLRDLWLEEADIAELVHDERSHDAAFRTPARPASLLNSHRMYYKLLDALGQVGGPAAEPSRLVEELDLCVTATDVRGLPLRVVLDDDAVVSERRHRNVFRFRYATGEAAGGRDHNDFVETNDPFLAFAARCTSAFPGAFEPMRLGDVRSALHDAHASSAFATRDDWHRFHRDYDREAGDFEARAFHDGGSLDNKPFTYATEALLRRRADTPVDRKLIYIEPSPDESALPGDGADATDETDGAAAASAGPEEAAPGAGAPQPARSDGEPPAPDIFENVSAALVGLPRYETIREDLERLLERNRVIGRVAAMLRGREEDVHRRRVRPDADRPDADRPDADGPTRLAGPDWARRDLTEMIDEHGIAYGAYHRLRVATVLDNLAEVVARLADHPLDSAEHRGARRLLRAWKEARFATYHGGETAETENAFLFRYDLGWWLRRFSFVQQKTGELLWLPSSGGDVAAAAEAALRAHPEAAALASRIAAFDDAARDAFDATLGMIRHAANDAYAHLRAAGRALRSRAEDNPLAEKVAALDVSAAELRGLARLPETRARVRAGDLARRRGPALDDFADHIRGALSRAIVAASAAARFSLDPKAEAPATSGADAVLDVRDVAWFRDIEGMLPAEAEAARTAQKALAFYYETFEPYDFISFPVLHEAGIGESDVVDVIRVSPVDAGRLVPDLDRRRRKLAGTAIHNFGAFFEHDWRRNDMVWGRLDAAERLLRALLPDARITDEERAIRDALIDEAHNAIFEQEKVHRDEHLAAVDTARRLDVEGTTGVVARAARVFGRVVEGAASLRGPTAAALARWPRRAGAAIGYVIDATVPGTRERVASLVAIAVLLAGGAALVGFGWRGGGAAPATGLLLFAAGAAGGLVLRGTRRTLRGRRGALKRAVIAGVAIMAVAILGAVWVYLAR